MFWSTGTRVAPPNVKEAYCISRKHRTYALLCSWQLPGRSVSMQFFLPNSSDERQQSGRIKAAGSWFESGQCVGAWTAQTHHQQGSNEHGHWQQKWYGKYEWLIIDFRRTKGDHLPALSLLRWFANSPPMVIHTECSISALKDKKLVLRLLKRCDGTLIKRMLVCFQGVSPVSPRQSKPADSL